MEKNHHVNTDDLEQLITGKKESLETKFQGKHHWRFQLNPKSWVLKIETQCLGKAIGLVDVTTELAASTIY